MNRFKERKTAFEIIFSFPFNTEKNVEEILDTYCTSDNELVITDYIRNTVFGVYDNLDEIDEKIKKNIKHRSFERLDNICLAALRLAIFEALYNNDIPQAVAVNEAIELVKQYDDSLTAFVHGNLSLILEFKNE